MCHTPSWVLCALSFNMFYKQDLSAKYSAVMVESLWPEMGTESKERKKKWMEKYVCNFSHQIKNKLRLNGMTL